MKIDIKDRITGTIFGLSFGESSALPSATHRLAILAPKRIARMKTLGEFADNNKQTTRPFPYTHAQPSYMLNPRPSDDTEWFAFVAGYLLNSQESLAEWTLLAETLSDIRARTGTKIALRNLLEGKLPPASGHDNPHYFDDISMIRALAVSTFRFDNLKVLDLRVNEDISITHSEDGLYCAMAVAHLHASLLRGETISVAIENALNQLPEDSWSKFAVTSMIQRTSSERSILQRYALLETHEMENIYAYPVSAPETLGLLCAHLQHASSPEDLIFAGLMHKRKLDSLPALMGAIAGAIYGTEWIPKEFKESNIALEGVCIPALKGITLGSICDRYLAGL
jgi:ADP-ribosylglycohydrolase